MAPPARGESPVRGLTNEQPASHGTAVGPEFAFPANLATRGQQSETPPAGTTQSCANPVSLSSLYRLCESATFAPLDPNAIVTPAGPRDRMRGVAITPINGSGRLLAVPLREPARLVRDFRFHTSASTNLASTGIVAPRVPRRCRARGVADEMPVRQRRQVCVGLREPARACLPHAWSGSPGVDAVVTLWVCSFPTFG